MPTRLIELALAVLLLNCRSVDPGRTALDPPVGIDFRVVSVVRLNVAESLARSPGDVFGLDLAVRLRLSAAARPLYVMVPAAPVRLTPEGHAVVVDGGKIRWRYGPHGHPVDASPGFSNTCGTLPCEWIELPQFSSLEWERLDGSGPPSERRAFTVFVKLARDAEPIEIVSSRYASPGGER